MSQAQASWHSSLLPASFRGVEFFVSSSSDQMGRNTVLHEYPAKDQPYVEDMGLATRKISFTAYVIGKNYFDLRNALEKALNEKGSGTLVHPYYGNILVSLSAPFSVQHSVEHGGMCIFSLEFVRVEEEKDAYSYAQVNDAWQVENKSSNLLSQIGQVLQDALQIAQFGDYVKNSVEAYASKQLDELAFRLGSVNEAINFAKGFYENESAIGESFVSSLESVYNNASSIEISNASAYASPVVMPEKMGTSQRAVKESQKAFLDATKQANFVILLQSFSYYIPQTRKEFTYLSDKAIELYDEISLEFCKDDSLLANMADLKIYAMRMLSNSIGKIPYILNVSLNEVRPALELSYAYLGDLSAEDIAEKNNIENPAFIPGGFEIELLKNQ